MEIVRTPLEYEKVIDYFMDHIDAGKAFSSTIKSDISFQNGSFYTFLPNNSDFNRLYLLESGGIVPNNNQKNGKTTADILWESISSFFHTYLINHKNNLALFLDIYRTPGSPYSKIEGVSNITYNETELLYSLTNRNSKREVTTVMKKTKAVWTYCGIVSGYDLNTKEILNENELHAFCNNANLVVTSAYDDESCIIWERKRSLQV